MKKLIGPEKYKVPGSVFTIGEASTLRWNLEDQVWELNVEGKELYLTRSEMNRLFQKVKLYRND